MQPLSDFGFHRLFENKDELTLLLSLLNAILQREKEIVSIAILKPEVNQPSIIHDTNVISYLCHDTDNYSFIVELHNSRQSNLKERALFYTTFPIQRQAIDNKMDRTLKPIYYIGLLGFIFDTISVDYLHTVQLMDKKNTPFFKDFQLIFVELPKFSKTSLVTDLDKWLFMLKNVSSWNICPETFKEEPFSTALRLCLIDNLSNKEKKEYEESHILYKKNLSFTQTAIEEARKREKIKIAEEAIMGGADLVFIQKITGLSMEELHDLKRNLFPLGINPMLI